MAFTDRLHNRGSIPTGYDIDNSLKFESDNAEYLMAEGRSQGTQTTWTFSVWLKRTELGTSQVFMEFGHGTANTSNLRIGFDSNDRLFCYGNSIIWRQTNRVFRDTSAWYHIVIVFDTTQSTASNRVKSYINGQQITSFETEIYPAQNSEPFINSNVAHYIGQRGDVQGFASGYLAEAHFIDGQALAPTDFGETDEDSGIWKPKKYTGTYGTNGFYLDFEDSSSLGADESGNGNDFTENNITSADQATDTPTNNFCTLNPLFTGFNSSVQLPSNGATQYGLSGGNQDLSYAGTMGVTKGKWYFENYINEVGATYGARIYVGFHTFQQDYDGVQVGASTNGDALAVWQMDAGNYVAWNGGSRSITSGLGTVGSGGAGKVVGIALNLDDNQISFYYDGSAVTNGTNLSLYNMGSQTDDGIFAIPVVQSKGSVQTANFGGYIPSNFISSAASDANGYGTFEYAPPSGYYALCTKNLAEYG